MLFISLHLFHDLALSQVIVVILVSLLYKQLSFINETTNPGTLHRVTEHVPIYISVLVDDVSYRRHIRTYWAI